MPSNPTERIIGRIEEERQAELEKQTQPTAEQPRIDPDLLILCQSLIYLTATMQNLCIRTERYERLGAWQRYRERHAIARDSELIKRLTLVPKHDAPTDAPAYHFDYFGRYCQNRVVTLPPDEIEHVDEHEVQHAWSLEFPKLPYEVGRHPCDIARVATEINSGQTDRELIYAIDGNILEHTFKVESFTDGVKDDPLVTLGKSAVQHATGLANQARDYLTNLSNE